MLMTVMVMNNRMRIRRGSFRLRCLSILAVLVGVWKAVPGPGMK